MRAIILPNELRGLYPLTEIMPTAMMPVLSRPVMVGAIEQLAQQGIKNVIVSLAHLPGSVEAYFGTGQRWNLSIEYVLQREFWGSAGALKWAENLLSETFLVLPADQIFELNVRALLAWHQGRGSQATRVLHERGNGAKVTLSPEGHKEMKVSTSQTGKPLLADTGIFLFEPSILSLIPARTVWDISTDLLPALSQQGIPVHEYELREYWQPICSFQDYQRVHWNYLEHIENIAQKGDQPVRPDIPLHARAVARGVWVGRNTVIHPTARISPPVFIGEQSFIGRDVELGPETMIGANVLIDDGATVAHSSVTNYTYVGQFVNLQNKIASAGLLIDVTTGESTEIVDQFLIGEVRTFSSQSFVQRFPDFFIAFVSLMLFAPFFGLGAILALISTGTVFTRLTQVGMQSGVASASGVPGHLKQFQLLHFATRRGNRPPSGLGQWLERWEFHRLPELWNVLIGDLRLIGVKPLSPDEASKMVEKWQQKRNEYFPGISGLWYLQTAPESTLDEILITDAYYVATRTWREDVRIFWKTFPAWWKRTQEDRR